MEEYIHSPVLPEECMDALAVKPDGVYIDATLGGGGHSEAILNRLTVGRLIGIDRDARAIHRAGERLKGFGERVTLLHGNFSELASMMAELGIESVSGVLFDFGVSSPQLDEAERGFSYTRDAPLDMRMDESQRLTAREFVNSVSEQELRRVLGEYGEERFAGRIARAIVREREREEIVSTLQLAEIIRSAQPPAARREAQHPAKRSFQAIRIAVNAELEAIEQALEQAIDILEPGGRLAAISFHSLEDRLVKNAIARREKGCTCPRDFPVCVCGFRQTLRSVGKNPVVPSDEECERNPRARSAKLRKAEKL